MMARQMGVVSLVFCGVVGLASADDPKPKPQEWRMLLIIKPMTRVKLDGQPEVNTKISSANIAAVRKAFEVHTPRMVKALSRDRLKWSTTVVESPTPLTTVSNVGDGHWIAPSDVAADYERYVKPGEYDGVFFYWLAVDSKTGGNLNPGFGWTIGRTKEAKAAAHTCVHHAPTLSWSYNDEITEVFLHEWLHQVESLANEHKITLPRGGLHGDAEKYHVGHASEGSHGWRRWYEAFINRELREEDGSMTGLGEPTWTLGTIREQPAP